MKPKYPTYDPGKDGNVYAWLLETSQRLRAERVIDKVRERFTAQERRELAASDAKIEEQEREHFDRLRAASRERKATRLEAIHKALQAFDLTDKSAGL